MKIIAFLGLFSEEQTPPTTALSTYGPAVKTAVQEFHAGKKQLKTDLKATPPVGSQLPADAAALATAKAQLKAARAQLGIIAIVNEEQPVSYQIQGGLHNEPY